MRCPTSPGLADPRAALASMVTLTPTTEALERALRRRQVRPRLRPAARRVHGPSLRWPRLAPEGKHVLVARAQYAPVPAARRRNLGRRSLVRTRRLCDVDHRARHAAVRRARGRTASVLTPADLETRFGLTEGAVTHGEITLDQILFMRPVAGWGRYAMPIDGLYLGGAGAHPGPGILGGAGWLAAKRALAR